MGSNSKVTDIAKIGSSVLSADGIGQYLMANSTEIVKRATFDVDPAKVAKVSASIITHIMSLPRAEDREKFAKCTNESFALAVYQCISYGLMPSMPGMDLGYFIPYGNRIQFKIGYRGLLDIARRSGVHAVAKPVYKGDEFEITEGLVPDVRHKPDISAPHTTDSIVGVYALAEWVEDGVPRRALEYMTKDEIDAVRLCAAKGSGAWSGFYGEMARKTVIRRAAKHWPLMFDAAEAIAEDTAGEFDFSKPVRVHAERPEDTVARGVREAVEAEVIEPEDEGVSYSDAASVMNQTIEVSPEAVEEMVAYHCGKIRGAGSAKELAKLIEVAGQSIPKNAISKEQKDRLNAAVAEARKEIELKETFGA